MTLQELNEGLYSRLLLLLSEDSPISDNMVQEAALKATTILVRWLVSASSVNFIALIVLPVVSHILRLKWQDIYDVLLHLHSPSSSLSLLLRLALLRLWLLLRNVWHYASR